MRVAIVGAGVGGLAAGIQLAHGGHRVTIFEQSDAAGGKCAQRRDDGFRWDAGPSLLTMPHVFEDLFTATGRPLTAELELRRVEPITRYDFADGSRVDISADLARTSSDLDALAPGLATDWTRFLGTCAGMWRAAGPFLNGPPPWPPRRPVSGEPIPDPRDALRVRPWSTLRGLAQAHTRDSRLQQIIERFATYAGADPRRAPAVLALAGYVEHAYGAWYPGGGLYGLVEAMVRRFADVGGELRLDSPVDRIVRTGTRVSGVDVGSHEPADVVVTDVDELTVRRRLLGLPVPRRRERSLSGLALMLGLLGPTDDPVHHRIMFPGSLDAEFDDIFRTRQPVRDPTVYVAAPGVSDPSVAPAGNDAWFVLVNAPAIGDDGDWVAAGEAVIDRLGVRERVVTVRRRTPGDLQRETGAVGGAIYGRARHGRLAALRGAGPRIRGVDGLWLVGGSVHPGGGLPLVVLGGRAVARAIAAGD